MSSLAKAQQALDAGSWDEARAAFSAIARESDDPVAFEGLAQVSWWLDDADACISARETAYRRHRELGDDLGAGRAATALAYDSLLFGHGQSVAMGWLARSRGLLEPLEEAAEHGWLAVREAELALAVHHDPQRALVAAEHASRVARAHHVHDLDVVALALQGLSMTYAGDVESGTERLDGAVAAATSGDVTDLMWMGKVCCWLIAACEETQDVARAAEWCERVDAICEQRDLAPLFNVCRIQYASVQVARGTWVEAEAELTAVLERLSSSRRASRLEAVVQLGELRRRQGRYGEAEALFAQAEFAPLAVIGRARIRSAVGDAASAWTAMSGLLRSLPPANRLARAAALFAAVGLAEAAGEHDAAVLAAAELRGTADHVRTDPLLAMAAAADAVLSDPPDAVVLLREAVRHFGEAGLPYDQADARLHLAQTLLVIGDRAAAREQLDAALPALIDLAATAGLAEARGLVQAAGGDSPGPLTARELEVLRLVSQGMSNHEIAATLVLSEHTVHRHVSNILTKLDQTSRAGAASYALSTGMLSLG